MLPLLALAGMAGGGGGLGALLGGAGAAGGLGALLGGGGGGGAALGGGLASMFGGGGAGAAGGGIGSMLGIGGPLGSFLNQRRVQYSSPGGRFSMGIGDPNAELRSQVMGMLQNQSRSDKVPLNTTPKTIMSSPQMALMNQLFQGGTLNSSLGY